MKKYISVIMFFVMLTLSVISTFADTDTEVLIKKLENRKTRYETIRKIKKKGGSSSLENLVEIMKSTDSKKYVKSSAICLLGELKKIEYRLDIENILEKDSETYNREAAASALGDLGDKKAIRKLKNTLKNEKSLKVKMRVAKALAQLGDKSGKEIALKTIADKNTASVKRLAAETLGEIGDRDVISQLENNQNNKIVLVRFFSKVAIKNIEMSGMNKKEKVKYLVDILKSNEMNNWASRQLQKIGTKKVIKIFKKLALKDKDIGGSASIAALRSLAEQGSISQDEYKEIRRKRAMMLLKSR